jgi:hypothetical protein
VRERERRKEGEDLRGVVEVREELSIEV